jgi:hypothetical protein
MASLVAKKDDYDSDEEVTKVETVEVETEPEEDTTLANSDVVTKYQEAARIANEVLKEMMALAVPGAKVLDMCVAGDASIEAKCSTIFKKKEKGKVVEKGVAFPVCVSINECVCNVSPLTSEGEVRILLVPDFFVLCVMWWRSWYKLLSQTLCELRSSFEE